MTTVTETGPNNKKPQKKKTTMPKTLKKKTQKLLPLQRRQKMDDKDTDKDLR